jgi:hypothetical protein
VSGPATGRDPWADPETPTEPGQPYAGPPATAPPGYGWTPPGYGVPGYAPSGYPVAGYGYPPGWPGAPSRPRRPGQVIASAVLAFVQSAMVLIASLYVWFFASLVDVITADVPGTLDTDTAQGLATEGTVLAVVQLASAILLITAGVMALNSRSRRSWVILLVAHGVQIALSIYWLVRLSQLGAEVSGSDPSQALLVLAFFFLAGPCVGLGLVVVGAGRRWFGDAAQA